MKGLKRAARMINGSTEHPVADRKNLARYSATKYSDVMPVKLPRKSAELTSTHVERFYRTRILSGEIAAGTKLPSNQELAREWSSSTMAVQRALATLAAEGLIERRQRRGTFVRDTAQQTCIGILVGPDLIQGASNFYRLLCSCLQAKLDSLYLKTRIYDNLTFAESGDLTHSHGNLQADRKSYPFKGFILIGTSNVSPRYLGEDIAPRSVFQDATRGSEVVLDYRRFVQDCVNALVGRGFERITYFRGVHKSPVDQYKLPVPGLHETARELGIPKPEVWSVRVTGHLSRYEQEIDAGITEVFGNETGAALKRKLPQAFLVQDDIAARPLILNLLKRGIQIPKDVVLCIQATSENHVYYGVPVFRYEFPVSEIVGRLSDILNGRIRGEEPETLPYSINGRFLSEE